MGENDKRFDEYLNKARLIFAEKIGIDPVQMSFIPTRRLTANEITLSGYEMFLAGAYAILNSKDGKPSEEELERVARDFFTF